MISQWCIGNSYLKPYDITCCKFIFSEREINVKEEKLILMIRVNNTLL